MAEKEEVKEIDVDISSFQFNHSAEFYELNEGLLLEDIKNLKEEVEKKCSQITKLKSGKIKKLNYSFFAFKKNESTPAFCKRKIDFLQEEKVGYILFIYNDEYVAVLKQNVILPKEIKEKLKSISYDDFVKFNIEKSTEFKYLNMRNTDGADYAVRAKTFEGNNLKKNISSVSSNKFAIQALRGKTGDSSFSINFGTSRLNQYCLKNPLEDVCEWVDNIFANIKDSSKTTDDDFLGNFATRKKFTNFKEYEPSFLLFNLGLINNLYEKENVQFIRDKQIIDNQFYSSYDKILKIDKNENEFFVNSSFGKIILSDKNSKINLSCDEWKKIFLENTPNSEYNGSFEMIVNYNNLFNVYFEKKQEVYMNGVLFCDSKLLEKVDFLMGYIDDSISELETCKFEKYDEFVRDEDGEILRDSSNKKIKVDVKSVKNWDDESEFFVVEKELKSRFECFICDDCEKEWADYIGINPDNIEFIACKYKGSNEKKNKGFNRKSSSASFFQEVVGQVLKNLGNLIPSDKQLNDKKNEWCGSYVDGSPIKRLRKGKLEDGVKLWEDGRSNPNYGRTFSIVVNFFSKDDLKKRFYKLKKCIGENGEKMGHREESYQQLWILSNFVHSCLEQGIEPKIYCNK